MSVEEFFDKLYNKHLQRKELRRAKVNRVPNEIRLKYKLHDENHNVRILVGFGVAITLTILKVYDIIDYDFIIVAGICCLMVNTVFQLRPRKCPNCAADMLRVDIENSTDYFCDDCRIKIETGVGTE